MESHEAVSWESMSKKLEVGQRDEPQLHGRTYRLAAIRSVQLPKEVMEVGLDGGHPEAKLLGQPFGRQALGDASENLHLTRSQGDCAR